MPHTQKFFKQPNEIILYLKGNKGYCGYIAYQGTDVLGEGYSSSVYGIMLSELECLIKVIDELKLTNTSNNTCIEVRSNHEWLKKMLIGENNPNDSKHLYEKLNRMLSNNQLFLTLRPCWIPTKNGSKKPSDLKDEYEHVQAQKILETISKRLKDIKLNKKSPESLNFAKRKLG